MDEKCPERGASGSVGAARARPRRTARVAALAGAIAVLAAAVPAAVIAAAHGPATPRVPVLTWRSCDSGFQCATARVPLSYAEPRGATISVAVIRHRATGPGGRLGTLFFNGGGPNEQIQGFAAGFGEFPAVLRERYDIVTFDPRGFGYSTQVRCFPTMAAENKLLAGLPSFPVGARQDATWERTWARFDARCAAHGGALIDHDTTADVARDMNLLREAVRDPVLNYYGESYGTLLGATYANLFPATVGHMILDGNLNPVTWTNSGTLPSSLRENRDRAAAATMRDFLDLCGQTATSACAFSAGSPAATRAKWATLLRRLSRHPVSIGTPPQVYTYADAIAAVPLGSVAQWQQGAALMQQLWLASSGSGRQARRNGYAGQANSRSGHGRAARRCRSRASGAVFRPGTAARRRLLGRPGPARPGRLPGAGPARLCPFGRLRAGTHLAVGGMRGLAGRRWTGPLLGTVEPAHRRDHSSVRQHRRPRHPLSGLGRALARAGSLPPADHRRVRAHRDQQPQHLRDRRRAPLSAQRRSAARGNCLPAERRPVPR